VGQTAAAPIIEMDEEARKARAKDKFLADRITLLDKARQQNQSQRSKNPTMQPTNGGNGSIYGSAPVASSREVDGSLMKELEKGPVDTEEIEFLLGRGLTYLRPLPPWWKRFLWSSTPFLFAVACLMVVGMLWATSLVLGWAKEIGNVTTHWIVPLTPPHVALFLVDDQGWNDVGYQSTDLFDLTPTIDALAADGIKLTAYYTMHTCTPARASLLTGLYTIHTGMQHAIITLNYPYALPLDLAIMPQYFQVCVIRNWGFLSGSNPSHRLAGSGLQNGDAGEVAFGPLSPCALAAGTGVRRLRGLLLWVPRSLHSCAYSCCAFGMDTFHSSNGFIVFSQVSESTICGDTCLMDLRSGIGDDPSDEMITSANYGPAVWRDAFDALITRHDTATPLFVYYAQSLVHQPVQVTKFV